MHVEQKSEVNEAELYAQAERKPSVVARRMTNEEQTAGPVYVQVQRPYDSEGTNLEHLMALDVLYEPDIVRKTSIICTLGPSSDTVDLIQKLIVNGMNIVRLNFSHGTPEYHARTVRKVHQALAMFNQQRTIAIGLDTKGPEIRTGRFLHDESVTLVKNGKIRLTTDDRFKDSCTAVILYVDYKKITRCLSVGSKVYLDDGLISLVVESVETDAMICRVENGGIAGNHVGVNLPGAQVDLPAVSKEDVDDLKFALDNDLDMIFASWVRNREGVLAIRQVLGDKGKHIKIIAKIESEEGVRNADEIIEAADGIMVARGDLGIEIAPEKVFLAQKMLIAKCNRIGKPVICATQMLDSMIYKPRPTRAETSDVANAVLDGADCVMLSGETASGQFPIASVQIMHHIAKEAESAFYQAKYMEEVLKLTPKPMDASSTTAQAVATAAVSCHAGAILCLTTSGRSAQLLSRCRPPCPIIAICWTPNVSRFLLLSRGIFPIFCAQVDGLDWAREVDRRVNYGIEVGKARGFIHPGEFLVVATGWRQGAGSTNTIRIITAA